MKPITTFHHKILRGILKLSQSSPAPSLYFLLGELSIEATLHMDVLMLFHNIWSNKECQAFSILEYILKVGGDSSLTFMTSQTH